MSKDNEKTLPKEIASDYSLPGRFEDGNSVYFDVESEKPKPKNRRILIAVISFLVFSSGFFLYSIMNLDENDLQTIKNTLSTNLEKKLVGQYGVGKFGTEHSHAAIAIFVNDDLLNFSLPQFQLSSKYIHFENHNPYLIHKHATGVPLEMLFVSLGIEVTQDCMWLNYYEATETRTNKFCTEQGQSLLFYVNGEQYHSDISQYILKHNDRILVSFGDEKSILKQLAYLDSLRIFDIPKKTPQYSGDGIII